VVCDVATVEVNQISRSTQPLKKD